MSINLNELLEDVEKNLNLEKVASQEDTVSNSDELTTSLEKKAEQDLTTSAYAQGEALARELLEKMANEININNAVSEADDAAKVVPTSEGTVEDTLQGTVEEGLDRGATSDDRVDAKVDEGQGQPSGEQAPGGVTEDGTEKKAEENMNQNSALAKAIMEKLAEMGGPTATGDTSAEVSEVAAAPNMIQQNDAANVAADDAKVQENPGTEGTISNVLEAIVARAKAQGAGSDNLVENGGKEPEQRADEEVEKAAAVSALVGEGCDFDTAVALVKQAEAELANDSFEQEKQAAFNVLIENGVDFDTAVALVKQAEEDLKGNKPNFNQGGIDKEASAFGTAINAAKKLGKSVATDAKGAKANAKMFATGKAPAGSVSIPGSGSNRTIAAKSLAKNKAVQVGIAGGAALAGAVSASGREKKAESDDKKAWKATGKALGRSYLEAIAGSLVGAGVGGAAGALLHKSPAAGIAAASIGSGIGGFAGGLHGHKASLKNTLQKERNSVKKEG